MIADNLVESARLTQDQDGYTAEQIFIVDGVTGSAEAKLYNALQTSGIPQYGDAHPVIPSIQVIDRQASPIKSGTQIRIEITYGVPSGDDTAEDENGDGKAIITSSLVSEQTHFDINGELIKAEYSNGISTTTNYATVEVQRPQMRITLSRKESEMPKERIKTYLGRINSVEWSGFPPKSWLCSAISVRENAGSYDVEYSFEYREYLWLAEIVLPINVADALANPIDKDSRNGYARFNVYETANFNKLGLSF